MFKKINKKIMKNVKISVLSFIKSIITPMNY